MYEYGDYGPGAAGLGIILVIFVIGIVLFILFLLTLQKALSQCSAETRTMPPGQVWLLLIPLFNLVWIFFVVTALAKSLGAEFKKRGIVESPNPGQSLGIAMGVLEIVSIIPIIGILTGIAALVCWIVYWVKIAGYSARIAEPTTVAP